MLQLIIWTIHLFVSCMVLQSITPTQGFAHFQTIPVIPRKVSVHNKLFAVVSEISSLKGATNTIAPSKRTDDGGIESCIIQDRKNNGTTKLRVSEFFRVPPQIHIGFLAMFGIFSMMLRFEPVEKSVESILFILPFVSKWEPLKFAPLTIVDWVIHVIIHAMSIEIMFSFYSLMHRSNDLRVKRMYRGLFGVYVVGFIQTLFTMLSHTLIGANARLENALDICFKALVQTGIFGTGLSVALGPWSLIPVFAGVCSGKIMYGNWSGRLLATFSLSKYFDKDLPALFKYSYYYLSFVPILVTKLLGQKGYSDIAHSHIIITAILCLPFSGMALSLNRKLKLEDTTQKLPPTEAVGKK